MIRVLEPNKDYIIRADRNGIVDDVVEVVRCNDCKYSSPNGKYGCKCYHYKLYETHEMSPNDFCSFGERKDEVEDAKY